MDRIVLASASPRRRQLLEMVGIEIDVIPSSCDEHIEPCRPSEMAERLSKKKCLNVAEIQKHNGNREHRLFIGADTIVVLDGQILGKPKDPEDAFITLKMLSGRTHEVYTGVTILDAEEGKTCSFTEKTEVTMFVVNDSDIRAYVETGEPMDKAGSYGIQGKGAFLVEKINGDYYNVVGLPVARLLQILKKDFGLN